MCLFFSQDEEGAATTMRHACPGHERAVIIEKLVHELDMKEEGDGQRSRALAPHVGCVGLIPG